MSDTRTTPYQTRTQGTDRSIRAELRDADRVAKHTAPRKRRQHHRTTRHAVRRILHCQGELPGGIYRMREVAR